MAGTPDPPGMTARAWWGADLSVPELRRRAGHLEQFAGVRLVTLADGGARGVRVLEFRTGSGFTFEVLVDRAFDLGRADLRGVPLSWHGAQGVRGPWYAEPDGLGFLRGFAGGLLVTGGLDHTLFPTEDTAAPYAYPPQPTVRYGLHGRVSNLPARLIGYGERWDDHGCTLWAEGEVTQAAMYGEKLVLHRRIETRLGAQTLRLHDTVTNVGWRPTPHMLLYHMNFGFPVVDEGSAVHLPGVVRAVGDAPPDAWPALAAPTGGAVERVYAYTPEADADGWVTASILNRRRHIGVSVRHRPDQLPHPFMWQQLAEGEYVVALEPSTNRVEGRHDARTRGELITLAPQEGRAYDLELTALTSTEDLEGAPRRPPGTTVPSPTGPHAAQETQ